MDTLSKKPRSKTRKTVSALAKVSLVLMGEPIPASSEKIVSAQKKLRQKNRPLFSRILKFIVLLLLEIISSKRKPYEPTLQEKIMGYPIDTNEYYIPDDNKH